MKRHLYKCQALLSVVALSLVLVLVGACAFSFAEETDEIPKEGVEYTLTYPDGTVVTENEEGEPLTYEDVLEALKEENWKLLGSDFTSDENGKAELPSTWAKGTIRIVEKKVPAGYLQGDETEKIVDLEDKGAEFVNPKKDPEETYYTITYKMNGGEYKGSPDDILETYKAGTIIDIHEAPTRDGYTFDYWKGSEYQPGDKYEVTEDHTFVAQWKKKDEPTTPLITKKKTGKPGTGDNNKTTTWSMILIISILSLLILVQRKHKNLVSADGSISMSKVGKMLLALLGVSIVAFVATSVYAAGGFTIDKLDDEGNPVEGAVFDVYGKPEVTFKIIVPAKTSVKVEKAWNDANNQDGIRPASVVVKLLANGVEKEQVTITAAEEWRHEFTDLDEKDGDSPISYTVEEETTTVITGTDGPGTYASAVSGNARAGYTITNTHTPEETTVSGNKVWYDSDDTAGARPGSITIRLHADGTEIQSKTVTARDSWKWVFDNLPKYSGGTEIAYTVTEDSIDEYQYSWSGNTLTNKYTPGKTSVSVTKRWEDGNNQDGIRPAEVTVKLFADGVDTGKTLVLSQANNWTDEFKDLNIKQGASRITYTVKEVETTVITGTDGPGTYSYSITGDATVGYTIKNTHTPETISIETKKIWDDGDDQDRNRPREVTIRLHADGTEVRSIKVNSAGEWKGKFENLPKYANGVKIVYTVTEDTVTGYTPNYSTTNYDITNKYTPRKTSVTVEKAWADGNNQDKIRPTEVTVKLLADGVDTGKTVTLNAANEWRGEFTDLDEKKAGVNIAYTVEEVKTAVITGTDGPETYAVTITGSASTGYTITNTHTPQKFVLIYDPNGGIIDTAKNRDESNDTNASHTFSIRDNTYLGLSHSNPNRVFMGWADTDDADVPQYSVDGKGIKEGSAGTAVEMDNLAKNVTLTSPIKEKTIYAVWGTQYSLTYHHNDYLDGNPPVPKAESAFSTRESWTFDIPKGTATNTPTRSNKYIFGWWGIDKDVLKETEYKFSTDTTKYVITLYSDGTMTEDIPGNGKLGPSQTLYAFYSPIAPAKLIFDRNGTNVTVQGYASDAEVSQSGSGTANVIPVEINIPIPTRPEYEFVGWADNPNETDERKILKNGDVYEVNRILNVEHTLYAIWKPQNRFRLHFAYNEMGFGWSGTKNGLYSKDDVWLSRHYDTYYNYTHNGQNDTTERAYLSDKTTDTSYTWDQEFWNKEGIYAIKDETSTGRYKFLGWSTDKNATKADYPVNDNGIIQGEITVSTSDEKDSRFGYYNKVLYAVWEVTPLHTYTLLFPSTNPGYMNTGSTVVSKKTGNSIEFRDFFPNENGALYSVIKDSSGNPYSSNTTERGDGHQKAKLPISEKSVTWTKEYLNENGPISSKETKTQTSTGNGLARYELLGYSADKGATVTYPVDKNGNFLSDVTINEPNDSCEGEKHNLILWPVYKSIPLHSYNVVFSANGVGTTLHYYDDNTNSWKTGRDAPQGYPGGFFKCVDGVTRHVGGNYAPSDYRVYTTGVAVDDLLEATVKNSPWTENFWKTQRLYATREDSSTTHYEFLGWSRDPDANVPEITVDGNYNLTSGFDFNETHESEVDCSEKTEGRMHHIIYYAVWKETPLNTYHLVFEGNTEYSGKDNPNSSVLYYDGTDWQVSTAAQTTETRLEIKKDGTASSVRRTLRYSHEYTYGPVNALTEKSYTWGRDSFWKSHGEKAIRRADDNKLYRFKGWAYDPNAATPDFTVDEDGFIEQDITISEPAAYKDKGGDYWIILYAVWEPVTAHYFDIYFNRNIPTNPNNSNVGDIQFYNEKLNSWSGLSPYDYFNGVKNFDGSVYPDTVWGIRYSSGELTTDKGYVWDQDFWDTHGIYATKNSDKDDPYTYEFLGWSRDKDATTAEYPVEWRVVGQTSYGNDIIKGFLSGKIELTEPGTGECAGGRHNLILHAVWKKVPKSRTYTLKFNGNGKSNYDSVSGTPGEMSDVEVYNGSAWSENSPEFTIPNVTMTNNDKLFVGWAEEPTASQGIYGYPYPDSSSVEYTVTNHLHPVISYPWETHKIFPGWTYMDYTNAEKTLYAVWWYRYELQYDGNVTDDSVSGVPADELSYWSETPYSYNIKSHTIPTREGYTFLGWSENKDDTEPTYIYTTESGTIVFNKKVDFNASITGSQTKVLYAIWKLNE